MHMNIILLIFNPIMSVFFAAGFYMLWRHQRQLHFIVILYVSYLIRAACFLVLYIAVENGNTVLRLVANALILLTTSLLVIAFAKRLNQAPKYKLLAFICVVTIAGLQFYASADNGLEKRSILINLGIFSILMVFLKHIASAKDRNPVEQFLLIQVGLASVVVLARPFIIMSSPLMGLDYVSFYWLFTSVSDAIVSTALAVAIFAVIASDVIENIKKEAHTDMLSGLLNRRGFERRACAVLGGETSDYPSAMIMCDLDHFKSINDNFGHPVGDKVIRAFAEKLKENAPPRTLIGRLGGEEFAILVMRNSMVTPQSIAERAQSSFNAISPGIVNGRAHPTASFGIAFVNEGDDLSNLLGRADRCLYQAKNSGRNCICQEGGERVAAAA